MGRILAIGDVHGCHRALVPTLFVVLAIFVVGLVYNQAVSLKATETTIEVETRPQQESATTDKTKDN